MPSHIVSIHAHPDDAEILCGGTLALLSAKGHAITIVTMTPGDKGSHRHTAEEIAAIRRQEARTAAAQIGAEYICAEFRDLEIFSDSASRRRVVELLRRLRPDAVLTSSPVDYLADHEATALLVRDGLFAAPAPNYATGHPDPAPALKSIPHLYFMDPVGGVDRDGRAIPPDFTVNVESTFGTKKAMLAAHKSQDEWLTAHHGMSDYLAMMEDWTRQRGAEAGVAFGEGFRQYKGHPYPESPLLQELLDGFVIRS